MLMMNFEYVDRREGDWMMLMERVNKITLYIVAI